jgi:hypothetical protein
MGVEWMIRPRGQNLQENKACVRPPLPERTVAPAVDFCNLYSPLDIVISRKNLLIFWGPSAADRVDSRPFDRASTVFLKRLRFPPRRAADADSAGSRHVPEASIMLRLVGKVLQLSTFPPLYSNLSCRPAAQGRNKSIIASAALPPQSFASQRPSQAWQHDRSMACNQWNSLQISKEVCAYQELRPERLTMMLLKERALAS